MDISTDTVSSAPSEPENFFSGFELLQIENVAKKSLTMMTRSRSYFREQDLLRFSMNNVKKELGELLIDRPQFEHVTKRIIRKFNLLEIGETGYFTTSEIAEREKLMLAYAGFETNEHVLKKKIVDAAIENKKGISEEQAEAVIAACLSNRRVTVIEGAAGAGKSFTMQAIKDAYTKSGYTVLGTALSWNAAKVLESSAGLPNCVALEGLVRAMLQSKQAGTEYFREPTLLIVDEAGLIGTKHMYHLLDVAHHSKAPVKVVLTGDSLQLNPVDAGNALQAIVEFHGSARIDTIRRQDQISHRVAVKRFSNRLAGQALYPFIHQEAIRWCKNKDEVMDKVVQDYLSYRLANPDKKALILALSNRDVSRINQRVHQASQKLGLVDSLEAVVTVTDGRELWDETFSIGDEVVVRANSQDLAVYEIPKNALETAFLKWRPVRTGVFNRNPGKIATITRSKEHVGSYDIHIDLLGDLPGRIILNTYTFRHPEKSAFPVVHNFATTIYASQGQTVNKVFLLDSPRIEFRLAYVGMSRHKESVDIYIDETEMHQRMDKMLGKRGYKNQEVGRYRRSEMLQMMALSWSKQSLNLTAMMFDRERKIGKKINVDENVLAEIRRGSSEDIIIDFPEKTESRIPLLNLDKILQNDAESPENQTNASVAEMNDAFPMSEVKVETEKPQEKPGHSDLKFDSTVPTLKHSLASKPSAPQDSEKTSEPKSKGFFGKALNFLFNTEPNDLNLKQRNKEMKEKVESVSKKVEAIENANPEEVVLLQGEKEEIDFFHPLPKTLGVFKDGIFTFPSDDHEISESFIRNTFKVLWENGRYNEPRIIAKDQNGEVVSRYTLDGECVVGDGYPPMMLNKKTKSPARLWVTPGAMEYLWLLEFQQNKNAQSPENIPHIMWAPKEIEWGWVAKAMGSIETTLICAKGKEEHVRWALETRDLLKTKWGISVKIHAPGVNLDDFELQNKTELLVKEPEKQRKFKR